jgi:hypothetical protein
MMLFSHGARSIGLVDIDDWQRLTRQAGKIGALLGVDSDAYPGDFASLANAHRELTRIRHLHPMPRPLGWAQAEEVLQYFNVRCGAT